MSAGLSSLGMRLVSHTKAEFRQEIPQTHVTASLHSSVICDSHLLHRVWPSVLTAYLVRCSFLKSSLYPRDLNLVSRCVLCIWRCIILLLYLHSTCSLMQCCMFWRYEQECVLVCDLNGLALQIGTSGMKCNILKTDSSWIAIQSWEAGERWSEEITL